MAALARFSRKTLTSCALAASTALRGGFRSNVQLRSFSYGTNYVEPEVRYKPWYRKEYIDNYQWLDKDDHELQFDCLIHHGMFFENRLEIPSVFIKRNGMEKVSQVLLYGKFGEYFPCDLKRKFGGGYYVQGHMVAMLYKSLPIPAGAYIVFKLRVDSQFRRDGIHRLYVMLVQRFPPDGKILSLKDISSRYPYRNM